MKKEILKPVEGYKGYYVSNFGRVYSTKKSKNNPFGELFELNYRFSNRYYLQVYLFNNGKLKCFNVHRLVAEAFISKPQDCDTVLYEVNHIDENKLNNSVDNLEWVTKSYNQRYSNGKCVVGFKLDELKNYTLVKDASTIIFSQSLKDLEKLGYNKNRISYCLNKLKCAYGFIWLPLKKDYYKYASKFKEHFKNDNIVYI